MDDLVQLKPTVFASVPRLYNKIYDGVLSAVNKKGGIAKQLFEYAFKSKMSYLTKGQGHTHALWDRVVFGKIKEKLGGRVKIMVTGSAPLSGDVINFFRVVFCTTMIEGYGQTENFCGISMGDCADIGVGHVGAIDPCCEIKLVDIPDLNYLSTDKYVENWPLVSYSFGMLTRFSSTGRTRVARSASADRWSSKATTRTTKRPPRPSTRTAGSTPATLASLARADVSRLLTVSRSVWSLGALLDEV
jgi:hypothetical protein